MILFRNYRRLYIVSSTGTPWSRDHSWAHFYGNTHLCNPVLYLWSSCPLSLWAKGPTRSIGKQGIFRSTPGHCQLLLSSPHVLIATAAAVGLYHLYISHNISYLLWYYLYVLPESNCERHCKISLRLGKFGGNPNVRCCLQTELTVRNKRRYCLLVNMCYNCSLLHIMAFGT